MWLPTDIIAEVDHIARIYYIDVIACKRWNEHRGSGELRLLTGWCWSVRGSDQHRQGFKTMTVAYRDAYYTLVKKEMTPHIRPRVSKLRIVA